MRGAAVAMVGALAYRFQELIPLLDEHIGENDYEVLPHVLMGNITFWLIEHREDRLDLVREVFDWLEVAYQRGDEDVQNVIAVSVVEMLPYPWEEGAELREMLGENLRSQLDT